VDTIVKGSAKMEQMFIDYEAELDARDQLIEHKDSCCEH
jgi:hypothetical protein